VPGAGAGSVVGAVVVESEVEVGDWALAGLSFVTLQPGKTAIRIRGAASALMENLNLMVTLPGPQFEPSPWPELLP
jgi:hypothetical protein